METHPPSARAAFKAEAARQFDRLRGGFSLVAAAIMLAIVLRTVVLEPFNIPSESMQPTLEAGDYLLVAKWPYGISRHSLPLGLPLFSGRVGGSPPRRGDVVVFVTPRDNRTPFIKRVIGLPGDRVRMVGGVVELNGVRVPKVLAGHFHFALPAGNICLGDARLVVTRTPTGIVCDYPRYRETIDGRQYAVLDQVAGEPRDDTPLVTVPPGHYFVEGDNRDDSADSRLSIADGGVGMVPAENLIGRAEVIFFATSRGRPRLDRIGTRL